MKTKSAGFEMAVGLGTRPRCPRFPARAGCATFPLEQRAIDVAARSFLLFMERCGVLSSSQRELVIERILALNA
jgi:hypothetical protein